MIERVLPKGVGFHDYARGSYWPVLSWARRGTECTVARRRGGVELACGMDAGHEGLSKRIRFEPDGRIVPRTSGIQRSPTPKIFSRRSSRSRDAGGLELRATPPAEEWRFPIETVAKSERGLDRTRQGESVTLRWPIRLGKAVVEIPPAR